MTTGRHAVLRADASPTIGLGHVARCRTLAERLVTRGWRVTIASVDLPDGLVEGLGAAGITIVQVPRTTARSAEPRVLADRLGSDAVLVVGDHYGLGADWFRGIRAAFPRAVLMALDDLADRMLPVDLVLNQNLGATADAYRGRVPDGTTVLAGPMYALLRPEFAALRARGRSRDGRVERILVFISGADPADVTGRAVHGLAGLGVPLDVVVGPDYPHLDQLRDAAARQSAATVHVNTPAMATLMDRADLAVGAPGSASWERCALGLPAVLVTMADNQVGAERQLVEAGAAISVGWHSEITAEAIGRATRSLCDDPESVRAMSAAAAAVTDGRGAERVVDEIERLVDR